ncbi:tRNA pseudouridine synthase Pus10-like [Biomphalaria glabrata]|uniref:tRNA pseudouridine(55) synthase n=1 Tax=Biomphalaria glabrata TaxID=6526 RepID=A0A9W2ZZ13_BIOGL|nr:tRNA pseudouridine synthase Pus10-like [Biomphalaria glabrata]XP_055880206.1 tRNA pseudouridine synthase Pus10-like [Biomphalaria glabrata]
MIDKMDMFSLFTRSFEETKEVSKFLHQIGCCIRCILRNLGELNPASYKLSIEELENMLLPAESRTTAENVCPCPGCLGILQKFTETAFLNQIYLKVKEDGFQFSDYQCSLVLPVSLIVRQKALYIYLLNKFGETYKGNEDKLASVKDVWKWSCGFKLANILGSRFQNRSQFDILMTFQYKDSDKECAFLLDYLPDVFKKRKQRKFGFETFTRANVQKAVSDMTYSKLQDCTSCPPLIPTVECTCDISCSHEAVFIAGRYLKFSRELSQTPWLIDGKRIMEGSVQELICEPIIQMFKPTDHKLSSSGREDVDVRMLGLGRPFIVELVNPHCVQFSLEDLAALQKRINNVSKDVQVRDLQIVSRKDTNLLKEGEIDKTKTYTALCWCDRQLTEADVELVNSLKEITLQQKTPLRVLHRRAAATRERSIHSLSIKSLLPNNRFTLELTTQAGTYVKEFVHGDFGRTYPNKSQILKADCDIIDLDVEAVNVDWPPLVEPIESGTLKIENGQDNCLNSIETRKDNCVDEKETKEICLNENETVTKSCKEEG